MTDKKKHLFLYQKQTLDTFLSTGALTQAEYDKSYGDLVRLMGMEDVAREAEKQAQAGREEHLRKAYFAGGCFWCITPVFMTYGAKKVVCGYSGGDEVNPRYEDVKAQKTGHRETICIEYDPAKLTYETLLDIFLSNVDPFDAEGQFIDKGFSYTLAVYYLNEAERAAAEAAIAKLESVNARKPAIAIEAFKSFYEAEDYHQNYYLKNPEAFEKELRESGRKKE